MPLEQEIILKDGRVISGAEKISQFNRSKFQARVGFEDKVFTASLRDAKRQEYKDNPKALQEHICGRFDISKGYYYAILKTKTMAISPSNRAQLEAMLLTHIGQVMTDHQNIRAMALEHAWTIATSDKKRFLTEIKISKGMASNGNPTNTIERKFVTREEGAYKWMHRVIEDEKMLYDTLKPFITRQFVEQLGDQQIENPEDMIKELQKLQAEFESRKNQEVA